MMAVRYIDKDSIYVTFPENPRSERSDHIWPPGVRKWLHENGIAIKPGILGGRETGIFLNGIDAAAFILKFGL